MAGRYYEANDLEASRTPTRTYDVAHEPRGDRRRGTPSDDIEDVVGLKPSVRARRPLTAELAAYVRRVQVLPASCGRAVLGHSRGVDLGRTRRTITISRSARSPTEIYFGGWDVARPRESTENELNQCTQCTSRGNVLS